MAKIVIDPLKLTTAADKFQQRKEAKVTAVKAAGDAFLQNGYPHDFGGEHGIQHLQLRHNDDKINWQTVMSAATVAAMNGMAEAPGPHIRTAENNVIQITYGEALGILSSLIGWAEGIFRTTWAKSDAAYAATTDAELEAVDPNTGWE